MLCFFGVACGGGCCFAVAGHTGVVCSPQKVSDRASRETPLSSQLAEQWSPSFEWYIDLIFFFVFICDTVVCDAIVFGVLSFFVQSVVHLFVVRCCLCREKQKSNSREFVALCWKAGGISEP